MTMLLSEVARIIGADQARVDQPVPPLAISSWNTDSRTIEPGSLFFALSGDRFDGHDFLEDVFIKGAAAAVVDRGVDRPMCLRVPDTLEALQRLAAEARLRWGAKVVAVTGSAGKTSTKDVIADLLSVAIDTGRTIGNLNNHIGLPLSILRLPDQARAAVIEMGMNHAGEIRNLARIAKPDIGVITNVGYAHVENFESPEGVGLAKRELIETLDERGVAVLNADDPQVRNFAGATRAKVVLFGTSPDADVRGEGVELSLAGARFRVGDAIFETPLTGRHAVLNVLAGIAVAREFGIPLGKLQEKIRSLQPGKMRGERIERAGMTIWNDCYNSNPEAARAMLDVLRMTPARRRIAVLGEMLELGRWAEPLHRDVGRYAAVSGVTVLVGIRGAARHMVDEAVQHGLAADAAYFFEDPATAGQFLRQYVKEGDAILFKGSRGTQVEKALEQVVK